MSYAQVFAEQIVNPSISAALRAHREERDALLASLTTLFYEEPRVRAVWLWGSFGRGEADDLSDLDPWLIVPARSTAEMGPLLKSYAKRGGFLLDAALAPHNGPPGGGYLGCLYAGSHGLHHVDFYWQPDSAVVACPDVGLLFSRMDETPHVLPPPPATAENYSHNAVQDSIRFMWLMLSSSTKYLARDLGSDMSLTLYPRDGFEKAITALGISDRQLPTDWSVPKTPRAKIGWLRYLVERCDLATAEAASQGFMIAPHYAPCLYSYLDLVQGIVMVQGT